MKIRHTIAHLAHHQQRRYGSRELFHHWQDGQWRTTSWRQATERAEQVGAGLWALGCRHGDRVAILSETRAEWTIADLGALGLGAVVVGIYPTSTAEQTRYVLEHSGTRVVLVEDAAQLAKVDEVRASLPSLEAVVVIDDDDRVVANEHVISLTDLEDRGRSLLAHDRPPERRRAHPREPIRDRRHHLPGTEAERPGRQRRVPASRSLPATGVHVCRAPSRRERLLLA